MIELRLIAATLFVGFLIIGGCWAVPQYNIYYQRMSGDAELQRQTFEKQVVVQAALAKKESASLLAEAEVLRAGGVAQANKIIGDSLKNNESYLRWLWIEHMADSKKETIYIPTEAGLPILEAGKR